VSETGEDETAEQAWDDPDSKEPGSYQPSIHHGMPVSVAPEWGRDGRLGHTEKRKHPPLACPNPRYMATFRGYYHCPGCGAKVPLAGQITGAQLGAELGERWAEALAGGVGQAFWYTVDLVIAIGRSLQWAFRWLKNRRVKAPKGGGVAPEMVHALVVMGMVAARYQPVGDKKEALK
jgi:hypothetical protein